MSFNGLSFNGLSFNGLSFNGLSPAGLSSEEFSQWYARDPALAREVMSYVVRCAVPAGESRSYTDPSTGETYTWQGGLGLAPDWARGQRATEAEEQVISACLAAHANLYRVRVPLSVLGRDARGVPIAYSPQELESFPQQEACFFGNLFNGAGLYVGSNRQPLESWESSLRACSLARSPGWLPEGCAPLTYVGSCRQFCEVDASGLFFSVCTQGEQQYIPLTTRLRTEDIFRCGDGTCQATERCGQSIRYDDCQSDCGTCR